MKKQIVMMIALFMLLFVASTMAYEAGDMELTLGGSGSSDESLDGTVFNIEAGLGYFLTQGLEAVVRQGVSYADVSGGSDAWNGSTRGALVYNFDMGWWYPYLGANIGYLYGDTVREQFIAGPEGGVKFFVNDTTFILAGLEYQVLSKSAKDIDDNFDDGRFVYTVGIGFKF